MENKLVYRLVVAYILIASFLFGCSNAPSATARTVIPTRADLTPIPTNSPMPNPAITSSSLSPDLALYEFPDSIDPAKRYLIYLHGKIIEDQGIPAVSPDFGEYDYVGILEALSGYGFVVISEQRPKDTEGVGYARKIADQVTSLLNEGVPATNITIVGASKGAGITIYVSHFLKNEDINYVIMGICHPDLIKTFVDDQIYLSGNVLSIYDYPDEFAGSCQELFAFSEGKGISRIDEIILDVGTGHGVLYQPLDEWITPVVQWAKVDSD